MNQPNPIEASATQASAEATDRKTQDLHTNSIEVAAPACVTAAGESPGEPAEAINSLDTLWPLRDLRACAGIVLVFQAIYLAADWSWTGKRYEAILLLHIFNILSAAIFLKLTHIRAYRDRIPQFVLGGWTLIFATTAALSILTLNRAPLTITLTITMVGVAALVPWDWRWQAGLAIAAVCSMAAVTLIQPEADPHLGYDWLAIVSAAGVAHYAALSGERYRREIASRVMALQMSHQWLLAESAEREAVAAINERVRRQLGESEAKLRKLFETSSDVITINRLSDGRYLDVNEAFGVFGYTREETLAGSAGALGVWADRAQLREFMKTLTTTGFVVNMEFDLRTKDGRIEPFLGAAKVMELDGEKCVVTIGRNIRSIKQTEADLISAREMMRGQIERLEQTEERLRAEILERTRAMEQREAALRRMADSESKLRKIFETSNEMITISRQSDGRYLEVNEAFFVASGYTREEALDKSAASLGIWPNRTQLKELLARLKTDRTVTNHEADLRSKSGAVRPYLVSATVIDLSGEACIVAISRDISALKQNQNDLMAAREVMGAQIETLERTEERLRAEILERTRAMEQREEALRKLADSEDKLRRVFDLSPDLISISRLSDGRYMDLNKGFGATGYSREEALERSAGSLGIFADRTQLQGFLDKLKSDGTVANMEFDLRTRSGAVRPYLFSATVIDLGGEACVVAIGRDITTIKETQRDLIAAREAALSASQAKSEFLSSMSHEIRTPMNAILGMADLLWESELDAEQRHYLDIMRNNGNMLLELINEILDLAKVESGRLRLEKTPLELRDLTEKLLDTLAQRAQAKGLDLNGRIAPGTPTALLGDPLRLRQILFNLIGNAIKFTQTGHIALTIDMVTRPPAIPALSVATDADSIADGTDESGTPVWIRFTVRDTGIGIAADQVSTIFSSFTQADSSIARKYGGSGLGLAIVKRLVALMGGEITVESAPAAGSSFIVTVPLEAQPAPQDAAADKDARAADSVALAGVRVLVVDDDTSARATLGELLRAAGATVEEAADGAVALAKADYARSSKIPYNVLLVDWRMPGMDGMEPVQRLAAGSNGNAPSPIVLMTAAGAPEHPGEPDLNAAPECRYLAKPIKRADLLRTVMEVTGKRRERIAATTNGRDAMRPAGSTNGDAIAALVETRPLRILLADDSYDNRMLIEAYLKKTRHTVDHAEDGAIAVEKVKANHYDLVLMDIQMPVMDGYTAVRTIRAWEQEHGMWRLPIIALTASALEESVHRSLEAGCDAHVAKPVRKATLLEAILNITAAAVMGPATNGSLPVGANGDGKMKRQQIQVDAYLRDLIPGFLEHKRADTGTIRAAIDRADYETISQIGHKMKGEGGSYGFNAVTEMGATLERAAMNKDLDTARHTLDAISEYLESVDVVYC
jgi:PAS domain S-box-containing protein